MTRRPTADGRPCRVCNAEAGHLLGLFAVGGRTNGRIGIRERREPGCDIDAAADSDH
jgi:hypothetical protein